MRLIVVSHPAVLAVNQEVYVEMQALGCDLHIIVPARWQHDYVDRPVAAEVHSALAGRVHPALVALGGKPLRHVYLSPPSKWIRRFRPDVAFLEQEAFALVTGQWSRSLVRAGVPFGIQNDENLDRPLPIPLRRIRRSVLGSTSFVAARSERARTRLRDWADRDVPAEVVPHPVPEWAVAPRGASRPAGELVVGYAGRLTEEKGLRDLLVACARLDGVRLLVTGSGPLETDIAAAGASQRIDLRRPAAHGEMAAIYAEMDVLVLPSHTTPTWAEQFGRVLTEALWCGVPVIGSSSGEIPWVIGQTGGGLVFRERDVEELCAALQQLRDDPGLRARLALAGREAVQQRFTTSAVARQLTSLLRQAMVS